MKNITRNKRHHLFNQTGFVFRAIAILALAAAPFLVASDAASIGPSSDFSLDRAVRVVVRPPGKKGVASSGFLWLRNDLVVTNVHAIPSQQGITVTCRGQTQPAVIEALYPAADLALLRVKPGKNRVTGKPAKPLERCTPFTRSDLADLVNKPLQTGDAWFTWGWHSGAKQITPRLNMRKGYGGKLSQLLGEHRQELKDLNEYGIPLLNIDLYHVEGGSLPGYSGAFVVDRDNKLVAIVDGGLDEGQSGYNWAIPTRYLDDLERSRITQLPGNVVNPPKILFSTGYADDDDDGVRQYAEKDPWTDQVYRYQWFKTKTRSLRQLASTSIDPGGILGMVRIYGAAAGGHAQDLTFDIYQDLTHGLIIATPVGQGLGFKKVEDNPGYHWLASEAGGGNGHIQFKQTAFPVTASWNTGLQVSPSDPAYFNEKISELLADCNKPGDSMCVLDERTLRIVNFANGDKVLRVGLFLTFTGDSAGFSAYDYYSFAVRGNVAFRAYARFSYRRDEPGLIQCAARGGAYCGDPRTNRTQLAQIVAVNLTTIANLGSRTSRSLETRFRYNPRWDNPTTIRAGYFENGDLRFYNSRGKIWLEYSPGLQNEYLEYERDAQFVYVAYGNETAAIPINGGPYQRWNNRGQNWAYAGNLERR